MLQIGTKVKYLTRQTTGEEVRGVVTSIFVPFAMSNENHGSVEVWLESETGYGGNNCEHFCYINYQEWLTIVSQPTSSNEFSVGTLLDTIYGKALIVKVTENLLEIFLYGQPNTYILHEIQESNNRTEQYISDIEDNFYEEFDDKISNEENFNVSTHCLVLLTTQLSHYLVK